jgi:hypothetical protein
MSFPRAQLPSGRASPSSGGITPRRALTSTMMASQRWPPHLHSSYHLLIHGQGLDGPRWDELYPQATPFSSTAEIQAALLRCPDVQVLQVRTAFRGCTEEPNRFNFPFDIGGTDRYASAPVLLSLDGHEFDWSDWSQCQRRFPVSGFWGRFASMISQPTSARLCLPISLRRRTGETRPLWTCGSRP